MARSSYVGIAIFKMIIIESFVTGETLSLRGISNSQPTPNSDLLKEEPVTQIQRLENSKVEQHTTFRSGHNSGAPNIGSVRGAFANQQFAPALPSSLGAPKGPKEALAGPSPDPQRAGAEFSAQIEAITSTVEFSSELKEGVSCLQLFGAKITQAWAGFRSASALKIQSAMGSLRRFNTAVPALARFLIVGLLALFAVAAWWLGSACMSLSEKTSKNRKSLAASNDPLAYAFAARSLEVRQAPVVRSWIPWGHSDVSR